MKILKSKAFKITAFIFAVLILVSAFMFKPINTSEEIILPNEELLKGKIQFLQKDKVDSVINTKNTTNKKTNIIILLADDLGKYDISLYGGKNVATPNIDSLAAQGVTFTDGYVSAPICSPSRAGLLTGRHQQRFGHEVQPGDRYPKNNFQYFVVKNILNTNDWHPNENRKWPNEASIKTQGLPLSEITFADLAKKQGYKTGIIGKWHLGHGKGLTPLERGFDYHFGFYQAFSLFAPEDSPNIINHHHQDFTDKVIWGKGKREGLTQIRRDTTIVDEKTYLTEKFAQEVNLFIEKNKANPFLLYVPFNAPHTPFQVTPKYYNRFAHITDENKRVYYAMISALDDAIGSIVNKVKESGLEENTLIFFVSDNGGATYTHATNNAPLKGGKFSHFEGGINVPFFLSWKGKVKPHTVYTYPVSTLDIFSTIATAIQSDLPTDRTYDGVDLVAKVNQNQPAHEALYWRSGRAKAIRKGDWKLVVSAISNQTWLYDLKNDKSETKDLKNQYTDKVKELSETLSEWEKGLINPLWPSLMHYEFRFGDEKYFVDL
jgi:arylsulfatase A-like enzyme